VAVQTLCFRWYNLVAAVLGLLLAAACWQGLQQRRQWVLRVFTFGQAVCAVLVVVGLGFLLHAVSNYGRQPGYCSRRGVYVVAAAIGPVLVVLYLFGAIYSIVRTGARARARALSPARSHSALRLTRAARSVRAISCTISAAVSATQAVRCSRVRRNACPRHSEPRLAHAYAFAVAEPHEPADTRYEPPQVAR
jgi:hypothetical protein